MDTRIYGKAPQIDFGLGLLRDLSPGRPLSVCNTHSAEGQAAWQAIAGASTAEQGYTLADAPDGGLALGGDAVGCMYGLLDLGHALKAGSPLPMGSHEPAIRYRGIKFNIPLDARTPSYSDASDSAWNNIPHVWEMSFWENLLDFLASEKYNVVSLWSLHPFPSMVRVPGYEQIALEDVMRTHEPVYGAALTGYGMYTRRYTKELETVRRMSVDEKISFWKRVMQYGADRGIAFAVITWNLFTYGTEGNPYGITDSLENPVTKDYFRKSVAALIETYPLLMGIGVTAGERMSIGRDPEPDIHKDVQWLADTYGFGVRDAIGDSGRPFRFIHRQHFSGAREILRAFEGLPASLDLSFKYSQAHMYSSTRPTFGNEFFASLPDGQKTWLTLRNDDMYMMRWGGVEFAREYISNMPLHLLQGFMMGPDGYTIGLDYLSVQQDGVRRPVLERQWYRTAIWGRLSYEPSLPAAHFVELLRIKLACPTADAERMFALCECVSRMIPLTNSVHWHDLDFQNYPEANCSLDHKTSTLHTGKRLFFHDIHDYLLTPAQKDSGVLSVKEQCELDHRGLPVPEGMISPDEIVRELHERADRAADLDAQWTVDEAGLSAEFGSLRDDCRSMALLGRFFAWKIGCALETQRTYNGVGQSSARNAIHLAEKAAAAWETYAGSISRRYVPQCLNRLHGRIVDVSDLCEDAQEDAEMVRMLMEPFET